MGCVIGCDLSVSDFDFGFDFLVKELGLCEGAANFVLEIVKREIACLELVIELFLGVGSLDLGELGIYVFIRGYEVELGGTLLNNLVVDEAMEDSEAADVSFFRRQVLRGAPLILLVGNVEFRALDVFAVDGGNHVSRRRAMAPGNGGDGGSCKKQEDDRTMLLPEIRRPDTRYLDLRFNLQTGDSCGTAKGPGTQG